MKKIQFPDGFVELRNKIVALLRDDEWCGIGGNVCVKKNGSWALWKNRGWDWPELSREIKCTSAALFLCDIREKGGPDLATRSNEQIFAILTEGMQCAWSKLLDREWEERGGK